MLRAFFFLLSVLTDYQTLIDIGDTALILGLVNVGVLSCVGIRFGIRHSLPNRDDVVAYQPGPIAPFDRPPMFRDQTSDSSNCVMPHGVEPPSLAIYRAG